YRLREPMDSLSAPILLPIRRCYLFLFFFHDPATTEIYTLSLHDALPISRRRLRRLRPERPGPHDRVRVLGPPHARRARLGAAARSEEHTSELQSRGHLVCRLLLEKKKLTSTT